MQILRRLAIGFFGLLLLTANLPGLAAQHAATATPPRLSLIEGEVSFWRPGAADWSAARQNTPLAPGDALYAGDNSNLELQIGGRAFVRAGEHTQISLINRQRDYLQFRIADGQASFDLRALPARLSVEVDTPNAAFTIEHSGYYRVNVDKDTTLFITRRGGRATVIPARGPARSIAPSEEVVVEGSGTPSVETYVAPDLDAWDRWNYARTEHLLDAMSSRYLPADVYGAEALDRYGDWRVVPNYGAVWVPGGLSAGWAPYSAGHWIWDPFYGWTWIDDAPWGWAPFHYGRWVWVGGFWAWAPGPVVQPVYAPALVVFFTPRSGAAAISWVALGWGEPLIPWWGSTGFVGTPSWDGWGGPRLVNNVVVKRDTVVNVSNVTFQNTRVSEAVVAMRADQFGRGHIQGAPLAASALAGLRPAAGALPVKPAPASLSAGPASKVKPTGEVLARPSVSLRAARDVPRMPWRTEAAKGAESPRTATAESLRFVPPPKRSPAVSPAPFGTRSGPERAAPTAPPRFEATRPAVPPAATRERAGPDKAEPAPRVAPAPTPAEDARERAAPKRAEPPRPLRPELTAPETARERAAARRPEPQSPPRARPESPPPVVAPAHETPRRETRREDAGPPPLRRGGPAAESVAKPPAPDEGRALPGRPANRMSPKHQGMEGAGQRQD